MTNALNQEPNYTTCEATNGEEAIDVLTEMYEIIDVVVLDILMPVTNGWETLQVIKDPDNGFPGLEVIMLATHPSWENCLKAWCLGAKYFMPKPISVPVLVDFVKRAAALNSSGVALN